MVLNGNQGQANGTGNTNSHTKTNHGALHSPDKTEIIPTFRLLESLATDHVGH